MKNLIFVIALVIFSVICIANSYAVKPPTASERTQASSNKDYVARQETGCRYGMDPVTKECYKPKEGQLYRDPKTGELKMKKIKKWNFPWKN